jgi:pyridoxal phosphate enzyme (YggS family)
MSQYEKAWQAVRARIAAAANAAGRDPAAISLVAVSKTFPAAAVRDVHALGQRAFGENYVQEAAAKRAALADLPDIDWRLIGPLQSNKTALAVVTFDAVETVDRPQIAVRLSTQRPIDRRPLDVLVQVNISGEATKSGVAPDQALALAREVHVLPRLRLRGYMGIAAASADAAVQARAVRRAAGNFGGNARSRAARRYAVDGNDGGSRCRDRRGSDRGARRQRDLRCASGGQRRVVATTG